MKAQSFEKAPVKVEYSTDKYYEIMSNFCKFKHTDFNKIHKLWYSCFYAILRGLNPGYVDGVISDLFYNFQMSNWKDLQLACSIYKGGTREELYYEFVNEVAYISDRVSYDRLFRTHWLFRRVFDKQLFNLPI